MQMSIYVRDLRHRIADIVGGATGPQDYELDGAILAAFEEVVRTAERAAIERCAAELERVAADIASTPDSATAHWVARLFQDQAAALRALAEPPP